MQFKNPLVTGGCGFIGSSLVRQLLPLSQTVNVVDNLSTGHISNLSGISDSKLNVVKEDIRNELPMRKLIRSSDVIFHLACLGVRHSIHSPIENNDVNANATLQMLKISKEEKIERFVQVSTSEVYGTATKVPMKENAPTLPHTIYGSSKLAAESHALSFFRTYNFPSVVIRPFNSYGPRCHHEGDSGEVIPKFMLRVLNKQPMLIFGNGQQTRDFSYVDDTARAILNAGFAEGILGKTINVGAGKEVTINQLAKIIADVAGYPNAITEYRESRPGDVLRLYADSSMAIDWLDFKPQTNLISGLKKLLNWYNEQKLPPGELLKEEKSLNWLPN